MGINKTEFAVKNYLNKHNIIKGNSNFQTVIINSFYCEKLGKEANEHDWKRKLLYVTNHFGLFCQYAQNNWKLTDKSYEL